MACFSRRYSRRCKTRPLLYKHSGTLQAVSRMLAALCMSMEEIKALAWMLVDC